MAQPWSVPHFKTCKTRHTFDALPVQLCSDGLGLLAGRAVNNGCLRGEKGTLILD